MPRLMKLQGTTPSVDQKQNNRQRKPRPNVFRPEHQISLIGQISTTSRSTRDLPRSGRPRMPTAAQDRYIRVPHLRVRFTTATSIASSILGRHRVFDQIVWIHLREAGRNARRPVRGVSLNQQTPILVPRCNWLNCCYKR